MNGPSGPCRPTGDSLPFFEPPLWSAWRRFALMMSGKSSKSPSCPCFFAFAASYSPTYSRVCENRWQIKFACGQAAHCTRIIQRILTTGTPTSPLSSISAPWLSTPPTIAVHSFPGYFCLCSSVPCTITSRASMGRRFAIPQIEYWFLIW